MGPSRIEFEIVSLRGPKIPDAQIKIEGIRQALKDYVRQQGGGEFAKQN